jgi:sugar O-acyltransferase (sialic acid O-acetyltransferase NeuD family)
MRNRLHSGQGPEMGQNTHKIVIIGDGEFGEIAYEYFAHDSPHQVVAFAVERPFLNRDELFGLPVVPFEDVETRYDPAEHAAFVAVTYTQLNRVRARLFQETKIKGYQPISYVSSRAFVWHNASIGANCFVFENNVVQYGATIGDNVILWSGNHIGHRSVIRDHCFLSSHVVVSGYCDIGESCFIGVNASIGDHVTIARDCVIGAGAVVVRDTEAGKIYKGNREGPARTGSLALFKVREAG